MELKDFFTYEEYKESFKKGGCTEREATLNAKNQILRMHGSEAQYKKDLKIFKAQRKNETSINKGLDKFQQEFDRIKSMIINEDAKKIYRQAFSMSLNRDKNRVTADRKARAELAKWEAQGNQLNYMTTLDVMQEVIYQNPDLDLGYDEEMLEELAYMVEEGAPIKEAVNKITDSITHTEIEINKSQEGYTIRDKIFLQNLSDEDIEIMYKMNNDTSLRPDQKINWTPEKMYRRFYGDQEAENILNDFDLDADAEPEDQNKPGKANKPTIEKEYYVSDLDEMNLDDEDQYEDVDQYDDD